MKPKSARTEPNRQVIDEACAWFVDFRVGDIDADAREAFYAWLRRSPEHIQAYFEIARTYAALPPAGAGADGRIDVPRLIAHARSSGDTNVVSLPKPFPVQRTPRRPKGRVALVFAASAAIAVSGTWLYTQRGIYSTDVGEQRSITLAEGSIVELNALSRVHVRFGAHERNIDLLQGQALFRVAPEKSRPFIVRSGETSIRAVGTQFDVYRKRTGTLVTVLEGRVAVLPASMAEGEGEVPPPRVSRQREAPGASVLPGTGEKKTGSDGSARETAPIYLTAGQQMSVDSMAIPFPTRANIAAATAWTQRQLVFDNSSLDEVAEEFNRYSSRRMVVDPAGLQDFHVSGMYSSTNAASLLRFLAMQPGIHVHETPDEIRISAN